jgi:signal transduction histidine kinase
MARDITEKKRAEAERAQLEAQLRQAQRMEAIGHLTGGIAHDFNNLLASIMGYIVLAAERESAAGDPKLGSYLDQALASSRGARDLIQQMLTFSRGQRGAPRALDLGAAVGESLKLLRSSLPSSLELSTVMTEVPAVMLDPVQLDQVLLNLSINARDAMAGSGRVAISVHPQTLQAAVCSSCRKRFAGEYVELAVADSGPGIPTAVLERMFERARRRHGPRHGPRHRPRARRPRSGGNGTWRRHPLQAAMADGVREGASLHTARAQIPAGQNPAQGPGTRHR